MKNYALNEHNFVQVVQGISSIKSHRKEGVFHERSHQIYASYQKAIFDLSIIGARFNFITEVAGTVFLVLILSWTSWSVYSGEMTTGALIAILQMTGLLMASAGNLALTNIQLQEARIAFHRMYEFTSIDLEEVGNGVKVENLADVEELKVSHLAFGFPGRSRLLENVSFEAKKGEMICIWGEIGSGKSTLFNILQRYLTYESGDVSINGEEISSIPLHILRSHIGVVPQDPVVFNGSLIENILLDQIPESKSGFQTFMEEYGLEQILLKFPDGLMTVLEEDGSNISGGQRRLINLIRTLYHRPQILLLDEITSDLDQESIQYLFSLLGKLSGNMSIIVLTHDVRVARHSDRIYILEDGKMNIQGSHDDLMTYENLYSNSWKDYLIPFMS